MNDALEATELSAALEGTLFGGKLHVFPTIESTSTYAMQQAQKGAPHGSVYIAEQQTAGRGRGAHAWHSEPDSGLYLSILIRPRMTTADALWLSLATGLAVRAAVENVTAMVADIRWPNDLLLGERKFGGILAETSAEGTQARSAVIGIGINANHGSFPPELMNLATSLRLESGRIVPRQDLLVAVLQAMQEELNALIEPATFAAATESILARMERSSTWIRGKRVMVDEAGGYTGVTAGLDSRGFLRVETPAGLRTVVSGGVRAKG